MLMVYVKSLKMKGYLVEFQYAPMAQTGLDAGKLTQRTVMVPSCLIVTEKGEFGIGPLDDIVPILSQVEATALRQANVPKIDEPVVEETPKPEADVLPGVPLVDVPVAKEKPKTKKKGSK